MKKFKAECKGRLVEFRVEETDDRLEVILSVPPQKRGERTFQWADIDVSRSLLSEGYGVKANHDYCGGPINNVPNEVVSCKFSFPLEKTQPKAPAPKPTKKVTKKPKTAPLRYPKKPTAAKTKED